MTALPANIDDLDALNDVLPRLLSRACERLGRPSDAWQDFTELQHRRGLCPYITHEITEYLTGCGFYATAVHLNPAGKTDHYFTVVTGGAQPVVIDGSWVQFVQAPPEAGFYDVVGRQEVLRGTLPQVYQQVQGDLQDNEGVGLLFEYYVAGIEQVQRGNAGIPFN